MINLRTEHIELIKQISSDLNSTSESDLEKFNEKIHKLLHKLLYENDDYIYSTLLFVKDDKIINHEFLFGQKIEGDIQLTNYIKNIQNILSRELRENKSTIGISNKVLNSKINGVVLYRDNFDDNGFSASSGDYIDVSYDLTNISVNQKFKDQIFNQNINCFDEEVKKKEYYSKFIEDEKTLDNLKSRLNVTEADLLKPILSLYFLSIPKSHASQNFYSYFIKPDTSHEHYDGLLNIALKKPLKSDELAIINLFLFYVFSEIALKETSNEIEREANEKYQVELAHIINGNIGQSLKLIKNGKKEFDKEKIDKEKIQEVYKLLKRTEKRGKVFLDLYDKKRGKKDFVYIDIKKIDFLDIINDSLYNNISNNISRDKVVSILNIIEKNKFQYLNSTLSKNTLKVEESIEILLYNAIHNAIRYSDDIDKLTIDINNSENFSIITISNDKPMESNLKDSINNNFEEIENFGFGMITISKVVSLLKNISVTITGETKTNLIITIKK